MAVDPSIIAPSSTTNILMENLEFAGTTDGEIDGAGVTRPIYPQDPDPESRPRVAKACETCRRRKRKRDSGLVSSLEDQVLALKDYVRKLEAACGYANLPTFAPSSLEDEGSSHTVNDSQSSAINDVSSMMWRMNLHGSGEKIKATHMERTIFGDASGDALTSVVDTKIGRVGALSCWEHIQPLLKYYLYSYREQIHVAAWPPLHPYKDEKELWSMSREGARALSQTYAIESQAFVLHATSVISEQGISLMDTEGGAVMNTPGGGSSAIFGPDWRILTQDIPQCEEGICHT
ncbi:hypothetical protein H9Q69_003711 [Fusarium xylarioides]|nr:hypothetical protein H9Q69_003711 [Fusarium xylarioides]